jgi:hypothetical protein
MSVITYAAREAIENEIEEPLTWQHLDEKRACRAFVYQDASIDSSPDTLEQLKDWAVERLIRFKEVFGPRVKNLRIQLPSEIEANP